MAADSIDRRRPFSFTHVCKRVWSVGTRDMYRTHSRAFARVSEHVRYALGAHVLKRLAYEVSADLVVYADRVHGEVVSTTRYDYRNTSVPFLQLTDTIYQIPACPCEEPLATEAGVQATENGRHWVCSNEQARSPLDTAVGPNTGHRPYSL